MSLKNSKNTSEDQFNSDFALRFWSRLSQNVPRILTHLDRDPDSPTFGCFDRNFWHYKTTDFPSAILQFGVLVIDELSRLDLPDNPLFQNSIVPRWVDGCLNYWQSIQLRDGSFNEYYPFEHGYPPTAFSLYSVSLIYKNRNFPKPTKKIGRALQKACDWILRNPESEALNQESAGLAACAIASRIPGIHVDAETFEKRLEMFLDQQSEEGWFPEYGGPDCGYLSVTLDCLWDTFDAYGDPRLLDSIDRVLDYLSFMVSVSGETPVMINSRNTDYIVPYGLSRSAERNGLSRSILVGLFSDVDSPQHFLSRTDDRYACHYSFQSCFRSLRYLSRMESSGTKLPCDEGKERYFPDAKIFIRHVKRRNSVYISAQKGGICCCYDLAGICDADYGWRRLLSQGSVAVTHWQNPKYKTTAYFDKVPTFEISGKMGVHTFLRMSSVKHFGLRMLSSLLGRRLIPLLKKISIFDSPGTEIEFFRTIKIGKDSLLIQDRFELSRGELARLYRAPSYSLRHVSSAGRFVPEELLDESDRYRSVDIRGGKSNRITRELSFFRL